MADMSHDLIFPSQNHESRGRYESFLRNAPQSQTELLMAHTWPAFPEQPPVQPSAPKAFRHVQRQKGRVGSTWHLHESGAQTTAVLETLMGCRELSFL